MSFRFAWRYFKSKKSIQAITLVAWVAISAIAVGTAALIIVLSIFNGFEGLVKDLYSSFYPDVRVVSRKHSLITMDSAMRNRLQKTEGIEAISYVLETNAHLLYEGARANVVMKGVDQSYPKVSGVAGSLSSGRFELGTVDRPTIVLGAGVEYKMGLQSDRTLLHLTAYLPKKGATTSQPMDAISVVSLIPSGVFAIQQDFDNRYVFTNIEVVRMMLGHSSNVYSSAEIRLKKGADPKKVSEQLQELLGNSYLVEDRYQQNRSLFAVMNMEKWVIYAILCLILILASFTMIGALTMLVLEKQQDIQILKAMGARNALVLQIFLAEGLLLAFTGGLIGCFLSTVFYYLQTTFKLIPLQGSFVIDHYPMKILPADVILVLLTLTLIAILASWIPSYKASRKDLSLKAQ